MRERGALQPVRQRRSDFANVPDQPYHVTVVFSRKVCNVARRPEAGASVSRALPALCGLACFEPDDALRPPSTGAARVVSNLTLVGLVVAVIGMLAFGIFADRRFGAYVPAHIENGVLVPGHIQ